MKNLDLSFLGYLPVWKLATKCALIDVVEDKVKANIYVYDVTVYFKKYHTK